MKIKKILFSVLLCSFFVSCKVENKKITELKNEIQKSPENTELLEKLMLTYLLETNEIDEPINIYENNEILKNNIMANIYYSTALCMKAGNSKTPSDQLKFVRKGMGKFEDVISKFPEDARCYVWQAITYSNFPAMLDAASLVLEAIDKAQELHKLQSPALAAGELKQLVLAYINIAETFKNSDYLNSAKETAEKYGLMQDADCSSKIAKAEAKIK